MAKRRRSHPAHRARSPRTAEKHQTAQDEQAECAGFGKGRDVVHTHFADDRGRLAALAPRDGIVYARVPLFTTATAALETAAPLASVTVPRIVDRTVWAHNAPEKTATTPRRHRFMKTPPLRFAPGLPVDVSIHFFTPEVSLREEDRFQQAEAAVVRLVYELFTVQRERAKLHEMTNRHQLGTPGASTGSSTGRTWPSDPTLTTAQSTASSSAERCGVVYASEAVGAGVSGAPLRICLRREFRRAGRGKSAPPVRRGESGSRFPRRSLLLYRFGGYAD